MTFRLPVCLGIACLSAWGLLAFDDRTAQFRIDSDLVLIPVSVTDARNHAVTALDRQAFRIFDDKAEQTIVQFAREDAPVSIGIVFDLSGSMRGKLDKSRDAVDEFLRAANPADEFFLLEFNRETHITVPFTTDADAIRGRLRNAEPGGRTALLDAVRTGLDYMKQARNARRALLILSDGGDNLSRYTQTEMRTRVREANVWIYAVGLFDHHTAMLGEESRSEELLESLAQESGGRQFAAERLSDLPVVAKQIGLELRNQYLLGYRPQDTRRDGRYHRVQVKLVEGREFRVDSRPGYYGLR